MPLGVRISYVLGLGFLRLRVRNSYVWKLVFLCSGVSFQTFGGQAFLRLVVGFFSFWG